MVHGSTAQFLNLQGQTHHRASSLHPNEVNRPRYAQLYIVDTEIAQQQRKEQFDESEPQYRPNRNEWPIILAVRKFFL